MLHGILRNRRFLMRGYVFDGPYAVGKTSAAYLFAVALMCQGDDPLGCGKCPSCRTPLEEHSSFEEVDAASYSGVDAARELMSRLNGSTALGRRRVVILDEAHRLSPEAWDVFLKPLELNDSSVAFLFVTSEGTKIPPAIVSRCAPIRFAEISVDALTGMLIKRAETEGIRYTQDGIRAVARRAKGRPRDAIRDLGLVAAIGEVSRDAAESALNYDADNTSLAIFQTLIKGDVETAVKASQVLAQRITLFRLVEALFSFLARDTYSRGEVSAAFAPIKAMTKFFIKWMNVGTAGNEITPMFIMELNELRLDLYQAPQTAAMLDVTVPGLKPQAAAMVTKGVAAAKPMLTAADMRRLTAG